MKKQFSQWLYFTRAERQMLVFFSILCTIVWGMPLVWRWLMPEEHTNFESFSQEISAFREKAALAVTDSQEQKSDHLPKKTWAGQPTGDAQAAFPFDPNIADAATLQRLGLSPKAVNSLLGYRSKGGSFKKPEDLKKLYGLSPSEYERVAPYALFPAAAPAKPTAPAAYSGGVGENTPARPVFTGKVEINRDPMEIWEQLPGIGEKRARLIVGFREKLGGFMSIEQVGETRGLPDTVFERIKPRLSLHLVQVRRININSASEEDLAAHPYCGKNEARLIVMYREQRGLYKSVEVLESFLPANRLSKLRPYLDVR